MKRRTRRLFLCLCFLLVLSLTGCLRSGNPIREAAAALDLDLSAGELLSSADDHGGFHGDGAAFAAIQFPDDSLENSLSADSRWRALPLSDTVQALVYGRSEADGGQLGPYLTQEDGAPLFPQVQSGYYLLLDRHSQAEAGEDEAQILQRYSLNFTVAIYDSETRTLYYGELDT